MTNFEKIKSILHNGNPIILNLYTDGRNYYSNHSVTVYGYKEIKIFDNVLKLLQIRDNWSSTISYIDYDLLCFICSINYIDKK